MHINSCCYSNVGGSGTKIDSMAVDRVCYLLRSYWAAAMQIIWTFARITDESPSSKWLAFTSIVCVASSLVHSARCSGRLGDCWHAAILRLCVWSLNCLLMVSNRSIHNTVANTFHIDVSVRTCPDLSDRATASRHLCHQVWVLSNTCM